MILLVFNTMENDIYGYKITSSDFVKLKSSIGCSRKLTDILYRSIPPFRHRLGCMIGEITNLSLCVLV